jgi:hypothetical protein
MTTASFKTQHQETTMFKKTLILASAITFTMGTFSTFALANPLGQGGPILLNCKVTNTCPILKPFPMKPVPINVPPFKKLPFPLPMPLPNPPAPKPQGPDINVNLDLGGGYNGGGYDGGYDDGISCKEGRSIVRHHGFKKVRAIDCSGDTFTYAARKHGQPFTIDVNMDGDIIDVSDASY